MYCCCIGNYFLLVLRTIWNKQTRCDSIYIYIYIYVYFICIKLGLHKVFTCLKSASHCRNWRIVLKNYSLQLVQVRLSQCYNKLNTAVDYCAVPVYRHIFFATPLDENVQLTSTFEWLSPLIGQPVLSEFEAGRENHKEQCGQRMFFAPFCELNHVRPDRRLLTI